MAIDWGKEWNLWKRIYFWYMKAGLLAIPFGIIYGFTVLRLGHDSKMAIIACLVGAVVCNYLIQGMPPDK